VTHYAHVSTDGPGGPAGRISVFAPDGTDEEVISETAVGGELADAVPVLAAAGWQVDVGLGWRRVETGYVADVEPAP
jgi:hypothetical protein